MNDPLATALAQAKEAALLHAHTALPDPRAQEPPRWPADQVAKLFRVCSHTVMNWERHADPTSKSVGHTVRQAPPITRMADVVRNTLQMMRGFGFGGDEMTARVLSRAGWKLSARTVGRIRRTRSRPPTAPTDDGHKTKNPVVARFVNHTWMMDATLVQTFLNGQYREVHVAGVFDAFSRVPLVLQTFETKPGASAMARLLRTAVKAFGKARYVITDQGGEFSGAVFRKTAARRGIVHRFGTVGNVFATARLERFWRTLKQTANLKYDQPLTVADLERRLETVLTYYLCFRPHQGLHGATPAEAFLGIVPSSTKAISPPRGRSGEGPRDPPFAIGFLVPDKRALPILKAA